MFPRNVCREPSANLGLLALLYAALGSAPWERRLLLAAFAGFWSARGQDPPSVP